MEEGEIGSETDQDPSVLEVPAVNWAKYMGVKSVQHKKNGPRTERGRRRTEQLGSVKCCQGDRKTICHGPSAAHDGDNKRFESPRNTRLSRTTTARRHA